VTRAPHRGIQERPGFATKVLVYHTSVQRNKRVALTYLVERLARLQTLAWEMGYVPERVKPNLVVAENEYFAQYCSLIHGYSRQFGAAVNIDLTESTKPPSDVSIEVRVLKEIGAIFTEEGMVQLSLGRMLSMRRSDAEPLVRSGKLEHVLME
jgi:GINS complex subunit 1